MFCISSAQGRHPLFYYRNSGNGISILADSIHIQNIHRLIFPVLNHILNKLFGCIAVKGHDTAVVWKIYEI